MTLLRRPKPKVPTIEGIKAFSKAAYKASSGAPPRLVSVYRSYNAPAKRRA